MRTLPALSLFLAATLIAGCIAPGNDGRGGPEDDRDEPAAGTIHAWPALSDAVIRPGVRVTSEQGSCTSNFIFRSLDNLTLYLGLAAHCLVGADENERVKIAGEVDATVAYNSWYTMDAGEFPDVSRAENDFALIRIDQADRRLVHPAILHYGGPTSLATGANAGERVLTYGNTPLRLGLEPSNTREGYVLDSTMWYTRLYSVTPGIPGDSGSAVLNGKGEALGVLIHLGLFPYAASNGAVNIAAALAFAAEHAEVHAELATWQVLEPGVFPDLP